MNTNASDKRKQKPDWNKRNFIVGVVVAVVSGLGVVFAAMALNHHEASTPNVQGDGIVQSGNNNTLLNNSKIDNSRTSNSRTNNSFYSMNPAQVTRVALPPVLPQTENARSVSDDDPYRYKATASFSNFATGQDRDDFKLGMEHIDQTHQRLGGFMIDQVIGEGRAIRKQLEAEQQERERRATATREEDEARRRVAVNKERAADAARFWHGDPACLVLVKSSFIGQQHEGLSYASGIVQNTCNQDFRSVYIGLNLTNGPVLEGNGNDIISNLRSGASWQWKAATPSSDSAATWSVTELTGS